MADPILLCSVSGLVALFVCLYFALDPSQFQPHQKQSALQGSGFAGLRLSRRMSHHTLCIGMFVVAPRRAAVPADRTEP